MHRTKERARAVIAYWGKTEAEHDKKWFSISATEKSTEIRIFDVIGWPFIEADAFISELNAIKSDQIKVRINSPGGDVFDGFAIYNALINHPAKITTSVEGLAASMASIIALAGDVRHIYKNAQYMIHNPWMIAAGDYNDFRKEAELLEAMGGQLAETYADRTGLKQSDIQSMMDETTWMTGADSVKKGFMQETITAGASAKFNLDMFANAPDQDKPNIREIERILQRDAGLSRSQSRALLRSGFDALTKPEAGEDVEIQAVNNILNQIREIV